MQKVGPWRESPLEDITSDFSLLFARRPFGAKVRRFVSTPSMESAGRKIIKEFENAGVDFIGTSRIARGKIGIELGRWRLLPSHYLELQAIAKTHGVTRPNTIAVLGLNIINSLHKGVLTPESIQRHQKFIDERSLASPKQLREMKSETEFLHELAVRREQNASFRRIADAIIERAKTGTDNPKALNAFAAELAENRAK
ncbi:MAG: hypothetical protein V1708_01640 [Candidatus Micrarchaeota archaeon]